ncbi:MAG: hypothetical protein GY719_29045 [bacterium]|nr:hypothetical protein [bacterium]
MSWENNLAKIRDALRSEANKRWGRIHEIEGEIAMWQGALSDVYAGRRPLRLDYLLRILDGLDLEPTTFFRRALGASPVADDLLADLEVEGDEDRALGRIAAAARELATAEPPLADRMADTGAEGVEELIRLGGREHLRRLRNTRRLRTHEFAGPYLEYLDRLRYDEAPRAAKRAEIVATRVLPALPGPQEDRISLLCLALGVFGSARRVKGRFTPASRAFRLALELARRHGLQLEAAQLLQRASYLTRDLGHSDRGLLLLREALEIYVDIDSSRGIGMTLVDRGMLYAYLGQPAEAVPVLQRALEILDGTAVEIPRTHLSAYQLLTYAFEKLGDLEAAEAHLERGVRDFGSEHRVDQAKLRWLQARLAFRRGDFLRSEVLLRSAWPILAESENALQEAMIIIDLVATLLAQGMLAEACVLAHSMARLLTRFRGNSLAETAIVQLLRDAAEGKLTLELLEEARTALEKERTLGPGAPLRI